MSRRAGIIFGNVIPNMALINIIQVSRSKWNSRTGRDTTALLPAAPSRVEGERDARRAHHASAAQIMAEANGLWWAYLCLLICNGEGTPAGVMCEPTASATG